MELALHVWTRYATFLHYSGTTEEELRRRESLDRAIVEALAQNSKALWPDGEWFECYADNIADHFEASKYYQLGQKYLPDFLRLEIKAIGAGLLGGKEAYVLRRSIKSANEDRQQSLLDIIAAQEKFANRLGRPWVQPRWDSAKVLLQEPFSE
jgi:hypothetical protein